MPSGASLLPASRTVPGVRGHFNLYALGCLVVLAVAWVIVIAAVVEIVRLAT